MTLKTSILITAESKAAQAEIRRIEGSMERLRAAAGPVKAALAGAFGAVAAAAGAREIARIADAYAQMSARLRLATRSGAEFGAALAGVEEIAARTLAPLAETAQLYTRIAGAVRNMGGSHKETLGIVEAAAQALRLSGASAQESAAALMQFSQALGSGVLRGEEFNSINEQAPKILDAVAEGMGRNREQLRGLAEQGQLTADVVGNALLKSLDRLRAQAAELPLTIGGSFTLLGNAATRYVGQADQASGASQRLAGAIKAVADNFKPIGDAAIAAAAAVAAAVGGRMVEATAAYVAGLHAKRQATLQALQADVAAAAQESLSAQLRLANAQRIAAYATGLQRLSVVQASLIPAQRAAEAAAAAHAAAQTRLTAAVGAAGAGGALTRLLGLLGGPVGLIATLGIAATAWISFGDKGQSALERIGKGAEDTLDKIKRLKEESKFGAGDLGAERKKLDDIQRQIALVSQSRGPGAAQLLARLRDQEAQSQDLIRMLEGASSPEAGGALKPVAPSIEEATKGLKTRTRILKEAADDLKKIEAAYAAEIAKAQSAGDADRLRELERGQREDLAARRRERDEALEGLAKDDATGARLADIKAAAEAEFRAVKEGLERAGRAYEDAFEDRLVSIRAFYDTKTRIEQDALDAEIRGLTAQRDAQRRVAERGADAAERIRAGAEVKKLEADIETASNKRFDAQIANARRARDAERELREELARVRDEILDLTGAATSADRRAAIERQFKPLLEKARANAEAVPGGEQAVLRLIDLRAATADLAAFETRFSQAMGRMQVREQSINVQRQAGLLTESQARQEILRLYRETAAEVEELIPEMERLADTTANPDAINRVGQMRNRVGELKNTVSDVAVAINGALGDGFKTLFRDIVSGSKTAKDAMLNFLDSVASRMMDIMAQRFAENLLGSFGASGGGGAGGGLGGFLADLFGFHAGGIIGAGAGSFTRAVPLSLIAAAPRYHAGGIIGDDEQVIIGRKGEEVLTEDDPRHARNGGGGVVVNVYEAPGTRASVRSGEANGMPSVDIMIEQIEAGIARNVGRGRGTLAPAVERTYGLSRAPGSMR